MDIRKVSSLVIKIMSLKNVFKKGAKGLLYETVRPTKVTSPVGELGDVCVQDV